MDRPHEAGRKTRSMLPQRGYRRSNSCHSCSGCSQLPNHPQETEVVLRQNFGVDRRCVCIWIGENRAVRTSRLIGGSWRSILQGRLDSSLGRALKNRDCAELPVQKSDQKNASKGTFITKFYALRQTKLRKTPLHRWRKSLHRNHENPVQFLSKLKQFF